MTEALEKTRIRVGLSKEPTEIIPNFYETLVVKDMNDIILRNKFTYKLILQGLLDYGFDLVRARYIANACFKFIESKYTETKNNTKYLKIDLNWIRGKYEQFFPNISSGFSIGQVWWHFYEYKEVLDMLILTKERDFDITILRSSLHKKFTIVHSRCLIKPKYEEEKSQRSRKSNSIQTISGGLPSLGKRR